jgi:transposase
MSTKERLQARRMKAADLLRQGKGVREVARLVGVSPGAVSGWNKRLEQGGRSALRSKAHPGRAPRLSPAQRKQLVKVLLRGACAAGYHNDLWTCPRVAQLIATKFGVKYHVDHVWKVLRSLGWTCQKPERRARERDEAAIQQWRSREWPRIKKGTPTAS